MGHGRSASLPLSPLHAKLVQIVQIVDITFLNGVLVHVLIRYAVKPNAGLERQAECVWPGHYQLVACPLEGPVGHQEVGNLADFFTLQLLHNKTRFDQIVRPPTEYGTT